MAKQNNISFACIEYSSKSGNVWRHSPEKPNYLANPLTEIDATSFGCYVSALKGEHIPLTGLIVGPVNPVNNTTIIYRKIIKRITGNWPLNYSLDYLKKFNVLIIVHQLSDAHEISRLVQRLKKEQPNTYIIGVPTQPFGLLKEALDKDRKAKQDFIDYMNSCDTFLSIVKETVGYYQNMTDTKTVYIPQPYPVEYASKSFLPLEKKEKSILIAGVTQRDNIIKGQIVAKKIQERFPDYTIVIPKVNDLEYDFSRLKGAKYTILPFEPWQKHLKTLAKMTLVINTDYTLTRGRVQTDCAAVGTPSIGANSDGQRDLYPELMGNKNDTVEKLVKQSTQLITGQETYKKTVAVASHNLEKYNYQKTRSRILDIIQ